MIRRLNQEERNELIRIFDENGYDVIDIEELTIALEEQGATYICNKDDVVDKWCDLMGIDIPTEFLDEDYIVEHYDDWEELSQNRFFNTYRMFEDYDEVKRLELNLECIKQQ